MVPQCPYECENGLCRNVCEGYDPEQARLDNEYNMLCVGRIAAEISALKVKDGHGSALRIPPKSTAGIHQSHWPIFRGDLRHTGKSNVAGPKTNYLQWRAEAGEMLSSPVVDQYNSVYVGANDGALHAFFSDGSDKWKFQSGGWIIATPVLGNIVGSDNQLYVSSYSGLYYCISANFGTYKWYLVEETMGRLSQDTGAWEINPGKPIISSAVIKHDGTIYLGGSNNLFYAINGASGGGGASGTVKWSFSTSGAVLSSPALDEAGRLFFGSLDRYIYCLDSVDGRVIWRYRTDGGVYSSPAVDDGGTVYVGSQDNALYALNSTTGKLRWRFRTSSPVYSSPAMGEDDLLVYVGSSDGRLYAVRTQDGVMQWNATLLRPGAGLEYQAYFYGNGSAPVDYDPTQDRTSLEYDPPAEIEIDERSADGAVKYRTAEEQRGLLRQWNLDVEGVCPPGYLQRSDASLSYRMGWQPVRKCDVAMIQGVTSSPAYADGMVYVGSVDQYVYALDASNGEVVWKFATGGEVVSSPALGPDGALYIGSRDGHLYAIKDRDYSKQTGG